MRPSRRRILAALARARRSVPLRFERMAILRGTEAEGAALLAAFRVHQESQSFHDEPLSIIYRRTPDPARRFLEGRWTDTDEALIFEGTPMPGGRSSPPSWARALYDTDGLEQDLFDRDVRCLG